MVLSINKITNKQLDKLVLESKYPLEQNKSCSKTVIDLACLFSYEIIDSYSIKSYISKLANEIFEQEKKCY